MLYGRGGDAGGGALSLVARIAVCCTEAVGEGEENCFFLQFYTICDGFRCLFISTFGNYDTLMMRV